LKDLAWKGLKKHGWDKSEKHIKALKKEIEDVRVAKVNNDYDFAKYFLIVKDYIDASRNAGILVGSGRGSGYASVMLRCLDITYGVDPMKYDLIWERFLGFDQIHQNMMNVRLTVFSLTILKLQSLKMQKEIL
jgi:DNA polymerase III alpha subunit